ncbi:MAG TPA: hypothetical protein VHA76_14415 [Solirubrobacterales bacterium]|nr:hypothetical protein [Solirubrobacterales bacterium]
MATIDSALRSGPTGPASVDLRGVGPARFGPNALPSHGGRPVAVLPRVALPFSPVASDLGSTAPPAAFMGAPAVMIVAYLLPIEVGVRRLRGTATPGPRVPDPGFHLRRARPGT